jgi:hypothetical protein
MQYSGGIYVLNLSKFPGCMAKMAHTDTPRVISADDGDKPRAAAQYIGALTRELARLARTDGCETLSYLLELAVIEAELLGGSPEGQPLS